MCDVTATITTTIRTILWYWTLISSLLLCSSEKRFATVRSQTEAAVKKTSGYPIATFTLAGPEMSSLLAVGDFKNREECERHQRDLRRNQNTSLPMFALIGKLRLLMCKSVQRGAGIGTKEELSNSSKNKLNMKIEAN